MPEPTLLFWRMMMGTLGTGFFIYGRKQKAPVPKYVGITFFIFPYLISNVYLLLGVAFLLILIIYFVRI
ncbi:MAG: hypothetical protein GXO91_10655 [FCB group bacterium]|nr:hypothetical protein [FCB group bacterium]